MGAWGWQQPWLPGCEWENAKFSHFEKKNRGQANKNNN